MRQRSWMVSVLLSASAGLWITGCFTGGVYQVPGHESLARDLTIESPPRVARSQQPDPGDGKFRSQLAPPPLPAAPTYLPPPSPDNGTKQVSLIPSKNTRVTVRALVNGKPIFDDEVMQQLAPSAMRELTGLSEPQRSERLTELYNEVLDGIIDQEVIYQDAVHKLEAVNKKALEKLKKFADEEFEKNMKKIRDGNRATEEQIKEVEHVLRKQTERNLVSQEYMRSRIIGRANQAASPGEVQDYYEKHLNEFQRFDSVKWQDVFIAVSPRYPTVAAVKRYAEDLIAQCRTDADFGKLIKIDDGDSKFRNGEGLGTRKGEIKPPEVEETLFKLKDGEIGPVIPMSTGVHIIRLVKREHAGQIPLDMKTQKAIENKIKNKVYEREFKQIVRELRGRATIEIELERP